MPSGRCGPCHSTAPTGSTAQVGRGGDGGQQVSGYAGRREQSAAVGHASISWSIAPPLVRGPSAAFEPPENHITTKIRTTWSMPYAAAVPISKEYIRLLIATEIGAVAEV